MFARLLGHLRGMNDSGATAVEYAIMAGFIAAVIVGAVALFGQAVLGLFTNASLLSAI
jgi:Flp pilus assembly pilin Flp